MKLSELKERVDFLYKNEANRDSEVVIPVPSQGSVMDFVNVNSIHKGIGWVSGFIFLYPKSELKRV